MLAFSTCWLGHRHTDGHVLSREVNLQGFDTMEVSHGTKITLFPGILKAKEEGLIRICGVHNFCPSPVEIQIDAPDCYEVTSHRAADRERAVKLTLKSIDTAERFEGKYVVMHLGRAPLRSRTRKLEELVRSGQLNTRKFVDEKLRFVEAREKASELCLKRIREALDAMVPYAEKKGIQLALESRSHHEQAPTEREMLALLNEYDSPAVGYWHDFGHVQRKANLGLLDHAEWLSRVRDRLCGCHLHDVVWPEQDHHIPLSGAMDYDKLIPLLPPDIPVVWEISPRRRSAHIREAVVKWKEIYGN